MALVWKKALTTAEDSDYKNSNVVVADISDFVSEVNSALASQVTTELVKAVDADGLRLEDDGGNGIFVKDGGNVGIGTTSPEKGLHIKTSGWGTQLLVERSDGNPAITIRDSSARTGRMALVAGDLSLAANGTSVTDTLRIQKDTGNVGIGVADPHSKLEVNGAISSAVLAVTSANDGTVAVGGINYIFIYASFAAVTINDFTGGVAGQVIYLVVKAPNASNTVTITDTSGSNQELYLRSEADYVFAVRERGGFVFICDGSNWYDVSHGPKHV